MDEKTPSTLNAPYKRRVIAVLKTAHAPHIMVDICPSCVPFIGRFTRLPELQNENGVIRYREATPEKNDIGQNL